MRSNKIMKKKEIVKNCVLSFLIVVCAFLFYKIWFSEKLWSSDYNFFTVLWGNSQIQEDNSATIEDILQPKKIIFSAGGKRFVSTKGEENFETYYSEIRSVLGKVSAKSKFTAVAEEEMLSAIRSSSVIVDFGTLFGGEIGTYLGTYFPCRQVKDVVISLNDAALGKPALLIRDLSTGEIYKTAIDMSLEDLKNSVAGHLTANSGSNIPFAFELGFNSSKVSEDSEITQNILLNSNILIGLSDVSARSIDIQPPESINLSSSDTNLLLRRFDIDKATAKKYIDANDDIIYIGSHSTLKISPSGSLEYTASTDGPVIYEPSSGQALPTAVGNIFSYVRTVFKSFGISSPALQISSDLVNLSSNTEQVTINIDYYMDSVPVMVWDNNHAITVTLKNGRLVSYRQQICSISRSGDMLKAGNMLKAVDNLYLSLSDSATDVINVSDIFVSYTDEDNISWCAKIDGMDSLIVLDGAVN